MANNDYIIQYLVVLEMFKLLWELTAMTLFVSFCLLQAKCEGGFFICPETGAGQTKFQEHQYAVKVNIVSANVPTRLKCQGQETNSSLGY